METAIIRTKKDLKFRLFLRFCVFDLFCLQWNAMPLPPHDDLGQLANRFNEYFFRKIELIRENVDSISMSILRWCITVILKSN
jgi:hypothetical protein